MDNVITKERLTLQPISLLMSVHFNPLRVFQRFINKFTGVSFSLILTLLLFSACNVDLNGNIEGNAQINLETESSSQNDSAQNAEDSDTNTNDATSVDEENLPEDRIVFSGQDSFNSVTGNFTLPLVGDKGAVISWESDSDSVVINDDGTAIVLRPNYGQGDEQVILTATIIRGKARDIKNFNLTIKEDAQSDAQAVFEAKETQKIGFVSGDSAENVTENLTLASKGPNGTTIVWATSNDALLTNTGKVTRPSYGSGDALVYLTQTISKGNAIDIIVYFLVIKQAPQTDAELVAADQATLAIDFASGDTVDRVTQNIILPERGPNATAITWVSSDTSIVDSRGQVSRPGYVLGDQEVTLTATISKNEAFGGKYFSVTVISKNDAPTADAKSLAIDEDASGTVTLTGTDPDNDSLTFAVVTNGSSGSCSISGTTLTYTPNANANGADFCTVTASDGLATSAAATVSVTITAVNDAPTAEDKSLTTTEDTGGTVTLTGTDPDGDSLTFAVATDASLGSCTISGTTLSYTPNANATGPDLCTVTASDGTATSAAATVSVTITVGALQIVSAETMDIDGNGRIDHYRLTFDKAVDDSSFPGFVLNGLGSAQIDWLVAGYNGVALVHGSAAPESDLPDDQIIYLKFSESDSVDSGAKPDLTTTVFPNLMALLVGSSLGQIMTANVAESDGAGPVIISASGTEGATELTVVFSEPVYGASGAPACGFGGELSASQLIYSDISGGSATAINAMGSDACASDTSYDASLIMDVHFAASDDGVDTIAATASSLYDTAGNAAPTTVVVINVFTDADAVTADQQSLVIVYASGDSPTAVTQGLTLTTTGANGTTIAWAATYTSDGADASAVVASDGSVTRPAFGAGDAGITLTATVTKGSVSDSKAFAITVKETIPVGQPYAHTVGTINFSMVYVPPKSFFMGTGDSGTDSVSQGYLIGETEVTYQLWYAVYQWAVNGNGGATGEGQYTFANAGREGHDGIIGAVPTAAQQEPVTTINWRDSIVWSNALTEYYNAINGASLDVVYYTDSGYTTPLRIATDSTSITHTTAGSQDKPYIKAAAAGNTDMANCTAKGFRLPTMQEWELAARYKDDSNDDGDILDAGEYIPGSYASGATSDYNDATATGAVAWYSSNSGSSTKDVKTRAGNALGLYDMSGNVWEWNFDWHPSFVASDRVVRGGSWYSTGSSVPVGYLSGIDPCFGLSSSGFRLSRTP